MFRRHMHGAGRRRIWSFLLESQCLPQFVRLFFLSCLRSSFAIVHVSHSVLFVLSLFLARCDRMSIRHQLLVPKFHRHIACTSLNSSSSPLFHSLCLGDFVFVCIHPGFSRQSSSLVVLIRSRHSLLCGLFALPCDTSAAKTPTTNLQCDREPRRQQTTHRIFLTRPLEFIPPQSLAMEVPLLLCQL